MYNVLIVDDIADNLRVLSDALSQKEYKIRCVKNGVAALKVATNIIPDIILLDIKMPGMDGYEVCQKLKANPQTQAIPVIFLSALDEVLDKVKAFEVGGVDYITKPFQVEEVLIRVKNQLTITSAKLEVHRLNVALEKEIAKAKQYTIQLETINQKLQQEACERKKAEAKLVYDALHDSLTGLPNRTLLMDRLDFAIKYAKRNPDYLFAVLFIDLNRFKIINDSMGHLVGDKLLIAIAKLLQEDLRESDTVARLGGDEFVILLSDIQDIADATMVGDRIQKKLSLPLTLENQTIYTGASIGIAMSLTNGHPQTPSLSGGVRVTGYQSSSQILRDADMAMYRAKQKGKGCCEVFYEDMYLQTLKHIELERDLRAAIDNQEFDLYYQPIVSLEDNTLAGFEALIRWQHPQHGFLSPNDFVSVAEDTRLIIPIGDWVLNKASQQLAKWQKQYATIPEVARLKMNVNVASQQFQDSTFVEKLDKLLLVTGLDPSCLKLEITERLLLDSHQNTSNTLLEIKKRQIKLSIDDFGTGYSSLCYLRRLPIDDLKIDRSFVSGIGSDPESLEIAKTIINLAHILSIDAVAEGIETREQLKHLKALGCKYAQGYLFAKPLSVKAIEEMLKQQFSCRKKL